MVGKYMASTGDISGGDLVYLHKLVVGETAGGNATVTIDLDSVQVAPIINVLQHDHTIVEFPGQGLKCDNIALSNCKVMAYFTKGGHAFTPIPGA
jgi:uncharacterized protein (UPF0261 family)